MLKTQIKTLFIILLSIATGFPEARAQRQIIRDKGYQHVIVPGKEPGTKLVIRDDGKVFRARANWTGIRPANHTEYPEKPQSTELYMNKGYLYNLTPSGALVWRKTKGYFYRQNHLGGTLEKLTTVTPPFNKYDDEFDNIFFQFVDDQLGYVYLDNSTKIFRTKTRGETWVAMGDMTEVNTANGQRGYIRGMHFINENTGFAWLEMHETAPMDFIMVNEFTGNRLVRTGDDGRTWQQVEMPSGFSHHYTLGDFYVYSKDGENQVSVYLYGDDTIYDSKDGGKTMKPRKIANHKTNWSGVRSRKSIVYIDSTNYFPFQEFFFNFNSLVGK